MQKLNITAIFYEHSSWISLFDEPLQQTKSPTFNFCLSRAHLNYSWDKNELVYDRPRKTYVFCNDRHQRAACPRAGGGTSWQAGSHPLTYPRRDPGPRPSSHCLPPFSPPLGAAGHRCDGRPRLAPGGGAPRSARGRHLAVCSPPQLRSPCQRSGGCLLTCWLENWAFSLVSSVPVGSGEEKRVADNIEELRVNEDQTEELGYGRELLPCSLKSPFVRVPFKNMYILINRNANNRI